MAIENSDHLLLKINNLNALKEVQNFDFYCPQNLEKFKNLETIQKLNNLAGLIDMKFSDLIGDSIG